MKPLFKRWLIRQLRERWLVLPEQTVQGIAQRLQIHVSVVRLIEQKIRDAVIEQVERW